MIYLRIYYKTAHEIRLRLFPLFRYLLAFILLIVLIASLLLEQLSPVAIVVIFVCIIGIGYYENWEIAKTGRIQCRTGIFFPFRKVSIATSSVDAMVYVNLRKTSLRHLHRSAFRMKDGSTLTLEVSSRKEDALVKEISTFLCCSYEKVL